MTALVFLAVLAAAWAHYDTLGPLLYQGGWFPLLPAVMTIYVAAFVVVLASACVSAVTWGGRRARVAAAVLVASFAAEHWAWGQSDPTLASGFVDLGTAAFFVLWGAALWELAVGGIYVVSALMAVAAGLGWLDDYATRPHVFIALTAHPDLSSLCGHAASVVVGAAAGDAGRRIRLGMAAQVLSGSLGGSALAGVARVATMARRWSPPS